MKQGSLFLFVASCLASIALFGCFGRIVDETAGFQNLKVFELDSGKPAIVTFGAVWCKPCRKEIEALNEVVARYGSAVQVKGYLVEGADKGSKVSSQDVEFFRSPRGQSPVYSLLLDPQWSKFDSFAPQAGRTLPLLVFVDRDGKTQSVFQRSLDLETEIIPIVEELLIGAKEEPFATPTPEPTPAADLKRLTVSVADYLALPEVIANPVMLENQRKTYEAGLKKFDFPEHEMPYREGRMTFDLIEATSAFPVSALWKNEETGCRLTIVFKLDGTAKSVTGVCGP